MPQEYRRAAFVPKEQQVAFRCMVDALHDHGIGKHTIAIRCRVNRNHLYRGVLVGPGHEQALARLGALYELMTGEKAPACVPVAESEPDPEPVRGQLARIDRFAPGCQPRWGR